MLGKSDGTEGDSTPLVSPRPLLYVIFKSHILRLTLLLGLISVIFASLATRGDATTTFLFVGGIIGAVSSVGLHFSQLSSVLTLCLQIFVMADIIYHQRVSAMRLLFWRAFSDLGVAVRFMLTYYFNKNVCGHEICNVVSGIFSRFYNYVALSVESDSAIACSFPSALLEFFEIASEMWFIIVAIDLWKSLVNPFSSTNSW